VYYCVSVEAGSLLVLYSYERQEGKKPSKDLIPARSLPVLQLTGLSRTVTIIACQFSGREILYSM